MYTGFLNTSTSNIVEKLIHVSVKYQMDRLKRLSQCRMIKTISLTNVFDRVILADIYKLKILRERCFQIILENPSSMIPMDGWKILQNKIPSLASAIEVLTEMHSDVL